MRGRAEHALQQPHAGIRRRRSRLRDGIAADLQCRPISTASRAASCRARVPRSSCRARMPSQNRKMYAFTATKPLRYLAVDPQPLPARGNGDGPRFPKRTLNLAVEANPRQTSRGRDLARPRRVDRDVLRIAARRRAVSELHDRADRKRPARRSQPGAFRRAEPAAADLDAQSGATIRRVRRVPGLLPRPRARASVVGAGDWLAELSRAVDQRRLRAMLRGPVRAALRGDRDASRDVMRQRAAPRWT